MKRSEMIKKLSKFLNNASQAEQVLKFLEECGMAPPSLKGNHANAVVKVYVYPKFHMWEEDFDKDDSLKKEFERLK